MVCEVEEVFCVKFVINSTIFWPNISFGESLSVTSESMLDPDPWWSPVNDSYTSKTPELIWLDLHQ